MGAGVVVVVAGWLAALSIYDIRQRRLPNHLTLPGAAAVLVGAALAGHGAPALLGALALFAVYLVVHLLAPAAMGAGDVKLAIGVGALTGAFGLAVWVLAALGAQVLTVAWAACLSRRFARPAAALLRRPGATVPHGPPMCVAAAVAVALAL